MIRIKCDAMKTQSRYDFNAFENRSRCESDQILMLFWYNSDQILILYRYDVHVIVTRFKCGFNAIKYNSAVIILFWYDFDAILILNGGLMPWDAMLIHFLLDLDAIINQFKDESDTNLMWFRRNSDLIHRLFLHPDFIRLWCDTDIIQIWLLFDYDYDRNVVFMLLGT